MGGIVKCDLAIRFERWIRQHLPRPSNIFPSHLNLLPHLMCDPSLSPLGQ